MQTAITIIISDIAFSIKQYINPGLINLKDAGFNF